MRVAVRQPHKALDLSVSGTPGQITPIQCNVRYPKSVDSVVSHSDYVINCVGILSQSAKQSFDKVQYEGARNIARACQKNNVKKLVHISAIGADDKSPSLYAQTKSQAEKVILDLCPNSTILRPSVIFWGRG